MRKPADFSFSLNGVKVRGRAYLVGRTGTRSPTTLVIEYQGKRYLPIHKRLGIIEYTYFGYMSFFWKYVYTDLVIDLLSHDNPLLKAIPLGTPWSGGTIKIPINV